MNPRLVDRIVHTLLYEGYILYPYRPALKNQQRWNFGAIVPDSYRLAQTGSEASTMQTECLVAGRDDSELAVTVRFLHLVDRQIGELTPPLLEWPSTQEPVFHGVDSMGVGDDRHYSWQEVIERSVALPISTLGVLCGQAVVTRFDFPGERLLEPIASGDEPIFGVIVRERQTIDGSVEVTVQNVGDGRFKVRVRIANETPFSNAEQKCREHALLHALVSTHTILEIAGGEFVSLIDPPDEWRALAADCRNEGAWPVLVGEVEVKDTMLSAPIILYDYPQVAAESAGDYFDATEIDEMLALRVMTLTREEKDGMAAFDERGRSILQRTHALAELHLRGLHGAFRKGADS